MYETAVASALAPVSYVADGESITVGYQDSYGNISPYVDVLHGDSLSISKDGALSSGLVRSLDEFLNSVHQFTISDVALTVSPDDLFSSSDRIGFFDDALSGDDYIIGSYGDDRLYGGSGNDTLFSLGGSDDLDGGTGDDTFHAVGSGSFIYGGDGVDAVIYAALAKLFTVSSENFSATVEADFLSEVEDIHFLDATLTFNVDSDAAFVLRLYDAVLNREPDAVGLDSWLDDLGAGTTRMDVALGFLNSPEFSAATGNLSTPDFVEYLYNSALGRPSDAGGKASWVQAIESGTSRADVLIGFSESQEHRDQTAAVLAKGLWTTDNDFQQIAALYDTFGNRLPDQQGLLNWVAELKDGTSLSSVASGFAGSAEFAEKTSGFSNEQLVDYMYHNTLDREADAGGKQAWVSALDSGLSKGDLLLGFSESTEHYGLMQYQLFAGVDFVM
ncbi:DUF4214 domain-containing protein [Novosphingobium sp. 9U]|uniref:DUF4214 domain-containing protein n=1 Tax=Novosphingobium sp. 9U TaxID=2653158 RepID=UPI002739B7DB|nr:DUF4214 domain-containing protein [Novosphingobium sp. 9U]